MFSLCRHTGGQANEILMWPLGGLAYCQPEHHWRAHAITAIGGPLVNVIIFVILTPILGILTGTWWGVAIPNLFEPSILEVTINGQQPWWLLTVFIVQWMSLILLAFNMLPIFPLDGGRIVQSTLWSKFGYTRSMQLAVYAGYVGAILLGITGAVLGHWMLIAIAIFGGLTCYTTLKQLQFTDEVLGFSASGDESESWGYTQHDADEEVLRNRPCAKKRGARTEKSR